MICAGPALTHGEVFIGGCVWSVEYPSDLQFVPFDFALVMSRVLDVRIPPKSQLDFTRNPKTN